MKMASMYLLSFVLGFYIWNCSRAKSVQQSKPFPLGEYQYAGFDKKGDKIVEGRLALGRRPVKVNATDWSRKIAYF